MTHLEPFGYITRAEGWAGDVYELAPDVALVTGYAPFGNVSVDRDICKRYDKQALAIWKSTDEYDIQKEQLSQLIHEFLTEALYKYSKTGA